MLGDASFGPCSVSISGGAAGGWGLNRDVRVRRTEGGGKGVHQGDQQHHVTHQVEIVPAGSHIRLPISHSVETCFS